MSISNWYSENRKRLKVPAIFFLLSANLVIFQNCTAVKTAIFVAAPEKAYAMAVGSQPGADTGGPHERDSDDDRDSRDPAVGTIRGDWVRTTDGWSPRQGAITPDGKVRVGDDWLDKDDYVEITEGQHVPAREAVREAVTMDRLGAKMTPCGREISNRANEERRAADRAKHSMLMDLFFKVTGLTQETYAKAPPCHCKVVQGVRASAPPPRSEAPVHTCSATEYFNARRDVLFHPMGALDHWERFGKDEVFQGKCRPTVNYDACTGFEYRDRRKDVKAHGMGAMEHWFKYGINEGWIGKCRPTNEGFEPGERDARDNPAPAQVPRAGTRMTGKGFFKIPPNYYFANEAGTSCVFTSEADYRKANQTGNAPRIVELRPIGREDGRCPLNMVIH